MCLGLKDKKEWFVCRDIGVTFNVYSSNFNLWKMFENLTFEGFLKEKCQSSYKCNSFITDIFYVHVYHIIYFFLLSRCIWERNSLIFFSTILVLRISIPSSIFSQWMKEWVTYSRGEIRRKIENLIMWKGKKERKWNENLFSISHWQWDQLNH